MNEIKLEMTRDNISLSKFLGQVRFHCKKKGIDIDIERGIFESYSTEYNHHWVKDGKRFSHNPNGPAYEYEITDERDGFVLNDIYSTRPCALWIHSSYADGSVYTEICEFEFDDEKTGHGYFWYYSKTV